RKLVQIEPSLDADSWAERERRYKKKFEAGRLYIPSLFSGFELPPQIEQLALFLFAGRTAPEEIAGGRIVPFHKFMNDVLDSVRNRPLSNKMIPEQYTLLRTLQFAARSWPVAQPNRKKQQPVTGGDAVFGNFYKSSS